MEDGNVSTRDQEYHDQICQVLSEGVSYQEAPKPGIYRDVL